MSVKPARPRRGLTLIEVTVSTVLVGVLLVGSLKTAAAVAKSRGMTNERDRGLALADEMMTAILAMPYSDPTQPVGNFQQNSTPAWGTFDDIDDFHWVANTPPQDADGTVRTDLAGWTRSVDVFAVTPGDPLTPGAEAGVRSVTVTVVGPSGATVRRHAVVTRDRLRSSFESTQNF